ncbi:MAG: NAD(+) synthase [Bernardetiaceae bacterium]
MQLIKVGGAALNQTPMDWAGNLSRIRAAIHQAQSEGVSILCLPELCLSGYGCEDMFYSENVLRRSLDGLFALLPETKNLIVCLGLPLMFRNRTFNAAALVVDGRIAGFAVKQYLAGNGIHYEPRWFTPWPEGQRVWLTLTHPDGSRHEYPMGDVYFQVGGVKIGFEICEDAWVSSRPGRRLADVGVDVILNPSASHFAFEKFKLRKRFVLEGSRAFGTAYIYANLLGNEAGRAIYDGGTLIASSGELVAEGPRLTFHDHLLTTATIDIAQARLTQAQASTFFHPPDPNSDHRIEIPFTFPEALPQERHFDPSYWEQTQTLQEEEFARAEALALYDYLRKSFSQGFVISLSGGADSAAVTCLCYLMIQLGIENIGLEKFKEKLNYISKIKEASDVPALARALITTAYQGTENSSETTRHAAQSLAEALHSQHHQLNIDPTFKSYVAMIEGALARPLTWEQDDIALQNIQARVRAPSIWMFANIQNALLLSTSNRSEAAVGYATMDGDTSGGLSPIAGIDKDFLRQWLRWLETQGPAKKYPIPALRYINAQQPTAELRPQAAKQTDEEDLMPYDILDYIEGAAIRDKKSPKECLVLLRHQYPETDEEQRQAWIQRFFRLWSRNQWKRERYAPSFHLDDKNLDPKTWCRFPILSGGFRQELEEMQAPESQSR